MRVKRKWLATTYVLFYRNCTYWIQKQSPEVFLKILQNSQENTCARVLFNKLHWKRDYGTGVFLWILRNYKQHPLTEHLLTAAFVNITKTQKLTGKLEACNSFAILHDVLIIVTSKKYFIFQYNFDLKSKIFPF